MSQASFSDMTLSRAQQAVDKGQALLKAGQKEQALGFFLEASELLPSVASLHALLADTYHDLKQSRNAIRSYTTALSLEPNNLAIWNNLGNTLRSQSLFVDAMVAYKNALKFAPKHPMIWKNLGLCYQYENDAEKAIECMKEARKYAPNDLLYAWFEARVLPIAYASDEQQTHYRQRYTQQLKALPLVATEDPNHKAIWDAFHLHYQGENDRFLQDTHGRLIHQIMSTQYPHYSKPLKARPNRDGPLRVGFASSMLKDHTISFLFGNWMHGLSQRGFEVFGYLVGNTPDEETKTLAESCTTFKVLSEDPERCAKEISSDQLDVLIYPELGMNRHLLKLAALRLAPTQAVTWGHPVTTGLPTIDAFLSSQSMEPENGDEHYTETLVRLPALSLFLTSLSTPKVVKRAEDFGLPPHKVLFLVPQSLYKLTPKNDWIYGAIAQRLPEAHFCFIANAAAQSSTGAIHTVQQRLDAVFAASTSSEEPRYTLLPGQSHDDFLALNACADIFLDAPGWSGGRTTLEAIGCGLIPIACPGDMMRQRHTAAILEEMGWSELIATSLDDYVDLATRIGSSPEWRERLRSEQSERAKRLLHRTDVLDALAVFCRHFQSVS